MTLRRHPPFLAALAVCAAVVAAFALGKFGATEPTSDVTPSGRSVRGADAAQSDADSDAGDQATNRPDAASSATERAVAPARAALPLPPPDAPLAEVIEELEARARGGDARAACRLSKALGRCHDLNLRGMGTRSDDQIAGMLAFANQPPEQQARELQRLMTERDVAVMLESVCAGIDRSRSRRAVVYAVQAALAGEIDSIRAVATAHQLSRDDLISEPQLAMLLHQHQLPMLVAAIQTGDFGSVGALQRMLRSMGEAERLRLPEVFRSPQTLALLDELIRLAIRSPDAPVLTSGPGPQPANPPANVPSGMSPQEYGSYWDSAVAAHELFRSHFAESPSLELMREAQRQHRGEIPQPPVSGPERYWQDDCEADW
jgi:hypothetical protein